MRFKTIYKDSLEDLIGFRNKFVIVYIAWFIIGAMLNNAMPDNLLTGKLIFESEEIVAFAKRYTVAILGFFASFVASLVYLFRCINILYNRPLLFFVPYCISYFLSLAGSFISLYILILVVRDIAKILNMFKEEQIDVIFKNT